MTVAWTHTGPAADLFSPSAAAAPSDDILVDRIARGDRFAMRALFARHRAPIYRALKQIVGDHDLAEDLLSEVFLALWRCARDLRAPMSIATELLAIAHRKAHSAVCVRLGGPALAAAEHRQIVDLVYYHRQSIREAAYILGISEAVAKRRMLDARAAVASSHHASFALH